MTNTETAIARLTDSVLADWNNSAAAERGWPAPTAERRPVAIGVRVEVTYHMPHRPAHIDAWIVRSGADEAEKVATMDLCTGRPQWRRLV